MADCAGITQLCETAPVRCACVALTIYSKVKQDGTIHMVWRDWIDALGGLDHVPACAPILAAREEQLSFGVAGPARGAIAAWVRGATSGHVNNALERST